MTGTPPVSALMASQLTTFRSLAAAWCKKRTQKKQASWRLARRVVRYTCLHFFNEGVETTRGAVSV
jgi:broad specificity polyphosphatase/5'/3'-nucleotidase SurE